jgi:hypothetical protein
MSYEFISQLPSLPGPPPHHLARLELGRDQSDQLRAQVLVFGSLQQRAHHSRRTGLAADRRGGLGNVQRAVRIWSIATTSRSSTEAS